MKILVVSSNNYFLNDIIKEWVKKGFEVEQIGFLSVKGKNALIHTKNAIKNKFRRYKIWRKTKNADLVWCEWGSAAFEVTKRRINTPIFLRIHTPYSSYCKQLDYQRISRTITISKTAKRDLKDYVDAIIVPNAIKPIFFEFSPTKKFQKIKICSVGNFISKKRMYDLVLTVEQLRVDFNYNFTLTLIGKGDDAQFLEMLEKRLPWLIVINWVDNLRDFFREQDFFLSHSSYESFGVAMVEAGLQGVIPLQHDKIIEHGVLPSDKFYYDSYQDLREKFGKFLDYDQTEYENTIQELRTHFKQYHPTNVAEALLAEYY